MRIEIDSKGVVTEHEDAKIIPLTEEQIADSKKNELNIFLSTLTVQRPEALPITLGFKFSADPKSIANISLHVGTMLDTDTQMIYEDWGNKACTRQELQEALRLAKEAIQNKYDEVYGV